MVEIRNIPERKYLTQMLKINKNIHAESLGVLVGGDWFIEEKHVKIDHVNTLNPVHSGALGSPAGRGYRESCF